MGKGYKGKNPRGGKAKNTDEEAEAEFLAQRRGPVGQSSNVGMLPPSDSEDEEGEEGSTRPAAAAAPKGQPKTAGLMPPSDSEDDDDDDSADEPEYFKAAPKKKEAPDAPDPEQIRKDLERLELIRKKREDDRKKRIDADGWDRFAPVTETNKPPGHYVPPKHDDDDD